MTKKFDPWEELSARNRAFANSPEGEAQMLRIAEKSRREEQARLRWEAENPEAVAYQRGVDAKHDGAECAPPDDEARPDDWLRGWNDEADEEEEAED